MIKCIYTMHSWEGVGPSDLSRAQNEMNRNLHLALSRMEGSICLTMKFNVLGKNCTGQMGSIGLISVMISTHQHHNNFMVAQHNIVLMCLVEGSKEE